MGNAILTRPVSMIIKGNNDIQIVKSEVSTNDETYQFTMLKNDNLITKNTTIGNFIWPLNTTKNYDECAELDKDIYCMMPIDDTHNLIYYRYNSRTDKIASATVENDGTVTVISDVTVSRRTTTHPFDNTLYCYSKVNNLYMVYTAKNTGFQIFEVNPSSYVVALSDIELNALENSNTDKFILTQIVDEDRKMLYAMTSVRDYISGDNMFYKGLTIYKLNTAANEFESVVSNSSIFTSFMNPRDYMHEIKCYQDSSWLGLGLIFTSTSDDSPEIVTIGVNNYNITGTISKISCPIEDKVYAKGIANYKNYIYYAVADSASATNLTIRIVRCEINSSGGLSSYTTYSLQPADISGLSGKTFKLMSLMDMYQVDRPMLYINLNSCAIPIGINEDGSLDIPMKEIEHLSYRRPMLGS